MSVILEVLMNRTTNELFNVIRVMPSTRKIDGNRSPDMMSKFKASYLRWMEELHLIAVDTLCNRISYLDAFFAR